MVKMSIIQHPYEAKIKDNDTVLLNKLAETENCIEYALKHNFNVLLTETSSMSTAEAVAMFIQAGFNMSIEEGDTVAPDGTHINPDICFLFTYQKNKNKETGYKIGDTILVKVTIVDIDEDGAFECCHVGCEKDYQTDDTDTMFFGEKDIVE